MLSKQLFSSRSSSSRVAATPEGGREMIKQNVPGCVEIISSHAHSLPDNSSERLRATTVTASESCVSDYPGKLYTASDLLKVFEKLGSQALTILRTSWLSGSVVAGHTPIANVFGIRRFSWVILRILSST